MDTVGFVHGDTERDTQTEVGTLLATSHLLTDIYARLSKGEKMGKAEVAGVGLHVGFQR